jgi:predicted nucleotidyltransferase
MIQELRAARVRERTELLEKIEAGLKDDNRIVAAYLWGSLGQGQGDELSDIDIWVIVKDSELPAILANLKRFATRFEPPLFILEMPQNGPVGGTAFHTLHNGERTGLQNIDWYLQPQSTARILPNTCVLFDRVGLPYANDSDCERNPEPKVDEIEGTVRNIRFFWLMLLICAKYAYRSPNEERMGLLVYVVNVLNDIRAFCGKSVGPTADALPSQPTLIAKIALLRMLTAEMVALTHILWSKLSHEEGHIQEFRNVPEAAERFLDTLVETSVRNHFAQISPKIE